MRSIHSFAHLSFLRSRKKTKQKLSQNTPLKTSFKAEVLIYPKLMKITKNCYMLRTALKSILHKQNDDAQCSFKAQTVWALTTNRKIGCEGIEKKPNECV